MAVCLDYQSVYYNRRRIVISVRMQIAAAVLLLLLLSFKVWIKIEATDLGYQLARARQQEVDLDMERRELALQYSVLMRSDNLSAAAQEVLSLKPLMPEHARRIRY